MFQIFNDTLVAEGRNDNETNSQFEKCLDEIVNCRYTINLSMNETLRLSNNKTTNKSQSFQQKSIDQMLPPSTKVIYIQLLCKIITIIFLGRYSALFEAYLSFPLRLYIFCQVGKLVFVDTDQHTSRPIGPRCLSSFLALINLTKKLIRYAFIE